MAKGAHLGADVRRRMRVVANALFIGHRAPSTRSRRHPRCCQPWPTKMAGQNQSGRNLTKAKTAGSGAHRQQRGGDEGDDEDAPTRPGERQPGQQGGYSILTEVRHAGHCGRHSARGSALLLATTAPSHQAARLASDRATPEVLNGRRKLIGWQCAPSLGGQICVGKTEKQRTCFTATSGTKSLSLATYMV